MEKVKRAKKIVVIGGGFVGTEFAAELSGVPGVEVHVIEVMPRLLYNAFDNEFCDEVSRVMISLGVKIHTRTRVLSMDGGRDVEAVTLEGGEIFPADMVLICVGVRPSVELARKAGLTNHRSGVYMG